MLERDGQGSIVARRSHWGMHSPCCDLGKPVRLMRGWACADKDGKQTFAPVMLRRLKKLGITKTDPAELTAEERSKWVDVLAPLAAAKLCCMS